MFQFPITREEGIANQWHVPMPVEMDSSTGLSITVSCNDIDGALQFVSDLLELEIIKLRFWGKEGDDYCVDENGIVLSDRGAGEASWWLEERENTCFYSYFHESRRKVFRCGINSVFTEYQITEFYKNQPRIFRNVFCLRRINYVDMIGNNEVSRAWYPAV